MRLEFTEFRLDPASPGEPKDPRAKGKSWQGKTQFGGRCQEKGQVNKGLEQSVRVGWPWKRQIIKE